jgi:hypothetical protein
MLHTERIFLETAAHYAKLRSNTTKDEMHWIPCTNFKWSHMNLLVICTSFRMWFVLTPVDGWVTQTPIGWAHVDLCTHTTFLTIFSASFHFLPHFEILFHSYWKQRNKVKLISLQIIEVYEISNKLYKNAVPTAVVILYQTRCAHSS